MCRGRHMCRPSCGQLGDVRETDAKGTHTLPTAGNGNLRHPATFPISPDAAESATVEESMKRTLKSKGRVKFPNRLWRYRRRMGFSQQRVAELAGYLSPSDISRFERGERPPSLLMALKLEIIYRVPVAFLFPDLYLRLRQTIRAKEERSRGRACREPAT